MKSEKDILNCTTNGIPNERIFGCEGCKYNKGCITLKEHKIRHDENGDELELYCCTDYEPAE